MPVSVRLYKQSGRLPKHEPLSWKTFWIRVVGGDAVMWTALALAALSIVVVRPPASVYAESIDAKTLACLASLMAASGGLMLSNAFDWIASMLVGALGNARTLTAAMVFGTFFASMLITNDVALIVFVPMTLSAFRRCGFDPLMTVALQTVAANVGSILLPMGNPQNLYLYSRYQIPFASFFGTVLPLSVAGAAALGVFCLFAKQGRIVPTETVRPRVRAKDIWLYSCLFVVSVLGVFDVVDYRVALALSVIVMAIKGRALVQQVDYALLLTFVGFFVFVGAVAHLPGAASLLAEYVRTDPFFASVLASQVISNVPAAVLLSSATDDYAAILAGVSAGGCGTLIASMASLISYKLFVRDRGERKRFLLIFTAVNVLFLAIMTAAYLLAA